MDDMIQMLEKIKKPEVKELAKKQIALLLKNSKWECQYISTVMRFCQQAHV